MREGCSGPYAFGDVHMDKASGEDAIGPGKDERPSSVVRELAQDRAGAGVGLRPLTSSLVP